METSQRSSHVMLGAVLIGVGALFLLSNMFNINMWRFFWPVMLIGIGLFVLTWNSRRNPEAAHEDHIIGEIKRKETGAMHSQDMWIGIGDIDLDLTGASFPSGITTYQISGFVGDIKVNVPANVGVQARFEGVAGDMNVTGQQQEIIFGSGVLQSPNYQGAERKLHLETRHFAGEIKVDQVGGM